MVQGIDAKLREVKEAQAKADAIFARAEAELDVLKQQLAESERLLREKGYDTPEAAETAASEHRARAEELLKEAAMALKEAQ